MNQTLSCRKRKEWRLSPGAVTGTQFFHACCWLYIVGFFLFPDGFGFRLGYLWSAKRILLIACYVGILANRERLNLYLADVRKAVGPNILIGLDFFVKFYTGVYRTDIYCIIGIVETALMFYLLLYIMRHELSVERVLKIVRGVLLILCLEGIWEALTGINLFGYISFASDGWSSYATRGGGSRICGNAHHSILFGVSLTVLFFLSCVDYEKKKMSLFQHPWLFLLSTVCVFLTGSRAPLGIYILGLFLICLFSSKNERVKSFLFFFLFLAVLALLTMAFYRTEFGRQVMYMVANMWDAVFRTRYADSFGGTAEGSTLYRDALAKVFDLWYFNKLVGRGASYALSVVIDGFWVRSCDNSYVGTYIQYAYPGLAVMIGHGVTILGVCLRGLRKKKNGLFAAIFVATLCYFLNIWYVASMGTYPLVWMMLALSYVALTEGKEKGEPVPGEA